MTKKVKDSMYLVYDGPSLLDGSPIIVLATGFKRPSANRKTGPIIQTYILRKDMAPNEALKTGADESICGTCELRGKTCYVLVHQAPTAVWHAYNRRDMKVAENLNELCKDQVVRFGSYGDPAAVPLTVWQQLSEGARNNTGYTHAWKYCDQELQNYCMASVDNLQDKLAANAKGWKTFRIKKTGEETVVKETICAAEKNADMTCKMCKLCDGTKKDIAITVHGTNWKINEFNKLDSGLLI